MKTFLLQLTRLRRVSVDFLIEIIQALAERLAEEAAKLNEENDAEIAKLDAKLAEIDEERDRQVNLIQVRRESLDRQEDKARTVAAEEATKVSDAANTKIADRHDQITKAQEAVAKYGS